MRQVDRLPFIFAVVLFLLAWLLGFPMRAQSAPLRDVERTLILDAASACGVPERPAATHQMNS